MNKAFIDFEYNQTNQKRFNLVCCAIRIQGETEGQYSFWLHNDRKSKTRLKRLLKLLRKSHIFISYNVIAEARSFISLGLDPTKFNWIDLENEWKMLINNNNKYAYGKQLIDGKIKVTRPPLNKYDVSEEQRRKIDSSKAPRNLIGACYKLTGVRLDQQHKDDTRDLILSNPDEFSASDQKKITEYCLSDVQHLPAMLKSILRAYKSSRAKGVIKLSHLLWRGETSARTALLTAWGYPVDRSKAEAFRDAIPTILEELCRDINEQFPDNPPFYWNKKDKRFSKDTKAWKRFIVGCPYKNRWLKTSTGTYSLALEAWADHYSYSHDYPRGNFAAQILRFLKTTQSLNGFRPKGAGAKAKDTFFDYLGPDDRARSFLNPYGSQSSRFQPKATGYIPLKSAWMRSLIEPKPGRFILGIDYSSQEFLLAAILSLDKVMYRAYASGDPYIYLAKLANAVPDDATKKTHPVAREVFKSTTLGIGYLMAAPSLAKKLTRDTGETFTEAQAEKLINLYFKNYAGYMRWISRTQMKYNAKGYLQLLDGWVMFGDNPNYRSVSNCPIQGAGACILRRAIQLSQDAGLRVIIPLHDALYFEIDYDRNANRNIMKARECMEQAFTHYFQGEQLAMAESIRLDLNAWGSCFDRDSIKVDGYEVKTQKIYIDERSKVEYERFSKYFSKKS